MSDQTDRLAAIEARKNAATPGPWIVERHDLTLYVADATGELDPISFGYVGNRPENNAEFIAHAPTDIAFLLDLIRKQQDELDSIGDIA